MSTYLSFILLLMPVSLAAAASTLPSTRVDDDAGVFLRQIRRSPIGALAEEPDRDAPARESVAVEADGSLLLRERVVHPFDENYDDGLSTRLVIGAAGMLDGHAVDDITEADSAETSEAMNTAHSEKRTDGALVDHGSVTDRRWITGSENTSETDRMQVLTQKQTLVAICTMLLLTAVVVACVCLVCGQKISTMPDPKMEVVRPQKTTVKRTSTHQLPAAGNAGSPRSKDLSHGGDSTRQVPAAGNAGSPRSKDLSHGDSTCQVPAAGNAGSPRTKDLSHGDDEDAFMVGNVGNRRRSDFADDFKPPVLARLPTTHTECPAAAAPSNFATGMSVPQPKDPEVRPRSGATLFRKPQPEDGADSE